MPYESVICRNRLRKIQGVNEAIVLTALVLQKIISPGKPSRGPPNSAPGSGEPCREQSFPSPALGHWQGLSISLQPSNSFCVLTSTQWTHDLVDLNLQDWGHGLQQSVDSCFCLLGHSSSPFSEAGWGSRPLPGLGQQRLCASR